MSAPSTNIRAWRRPDVAIGVSVTAAVFVVGLLWAKWAALRGQGRAGRADRTAGREPASSPSAGCAPATVRPGTPPRRSFTPTFRRSGRLCVVALFVSASVQALLPRTWLPRVLNRRRLLSSALAGGAAAMPSMMCTCCAAPIAVSLRRNGVNRVAAVAYWLGNPLLNPAVLVFLLFVAPWQWTVTRLLVGVAAVLGAVAVRWGWSPAAAMSERLRWRSRHAAPTPRGFVRALAALCLILLPEYAVMVLVVGAFRGWLLTLGQLRAARPARRPARRGRGDPRRHPDGGGDPDPAGAGAGRSLVGHPRGAADHAARRQRPRCGHGRAQLRVEGHHDRERSR